MQVAVFIVLKFAIAVVGGVGVTGRNWKLAQTSTLEPRQIEGMVVNPQSHEPRGIVVSFTVNGATDTDWPKSYLVFPTDARGHPTPPFSATQPARKYMEIISITAKQRADILSRRADEQAFRQGAAARYGKSFVPLNQQGGVGAITASVSESNGVTYMIYWPSSANAPRVPKDLGESLTLPAESQFLLVPWSEPRPAGDRFVHLLWAVAATPVTCQYDLI